MVALQGSLLTLGDPELDHGTPVERVSLGRGAWVDVVPGWLRGADQVFEVLEATVPWRQGRRWMYDRTLDDPRLSCRYGVGEPLPHPVVPAARDALGHRYGIRFGAVTLNYYRDGQDSVAFHRDRELRHLDDTVIAIVTFGERRPFHLRPLGGGAGHHLHPASGDLLVMGGTCQATWEHAVPKVAACGPRISMSVRWAGAR